MFRLERAASSNRTLISTKKGPLNLKEMKMPR